MKRILYSFVLLLVSVFINAQNPDFTSPINIPIILNGNFGEIRDNHFHAGIDIKTNGVTGLPISAVQEGYVSRISVSSTGYGKVMYIDHPSGYIWVRQFTNACCGKRQPAGPIGRWRRGGFRAWPVDRRVGLQPVAGLSRRARRGAGPGGGGKGLENRRPGRAAIGRRTNAQP